jgi:hypothetical protein
MGRSSFLAGVCDFVRSDAQGGGVLMEAEPRVV